MFLGLTAVELATTVGVLLCCGLVAGFLAGLLGVGGGIVFVPCFFFIFKLFFNVNSDVAMLIATGTSLLCMVPTSVSAALAQHRRGNTDLNIIKTWAPGMIIGVLGGALLSSFYGGKWLAILFGTVMIINSANTLLRSKAKPAFDSLPGNFGQRIIGFCIAFFSVMLGIGGGTLTVPILNACSVPPHRSVGTSSAVSLFVCIPGVLVMLLSSPTELGSPIGTLGHVNWLAALCVVPLSILAAPYGVKIGKSIAPVTLKRIFAVALFIISLRMLYSGFFD